MGIINLPVLLEYYGTSEAKVKHLKPLELNQFSGELLENKERLQMCQNEFNTLFQTSFKRNSEFSVLLLYIGPYTPFSTLQLNFPQGEHKTHTPLQCSKALE